MSLETFEVKWIDLETVQPYEKERLAEIQRKGKAAVARACKARLSKLQPHVDPIKWGEGTCLFCGERLNDEVDENAGYRGYKTREEWEYPRGPRGGHRKPVRRYVEVPLHKPDCKGWQAVQKMRETCEKAGVTDWRGAYKEEGAL
jgi:hypothetical protein